MNEVPDPSVSTAVEEASATASTASETIKDRSDMMLSGEKKRLCEDDR